MEIEIGGVQRMSLMTKLASMTFSAKALGWVIAGCLSVTAVTATVAYFKGRSDERSGITEDLLKAQNKAVTEALKKERADSKDRLDNMARMYAVYLNYKLDAQKTQLELDSADVSCEKVVIYVEPDETKPRPAAPQNPVVTYRVSDDVARLFHNAFRASNAATHPDRR